MLCHHLASGPQSQCGWHRLGTWPHNIPCNARLGLGNEPGTLDSHQTVNSGGGQSPWPRGGACAGMAAIFRVAAWMVAAETTGRAIGGIAGTVGAAGSVAVEPGGIGRFPVLEGLTLPAPAISLLAALLLGWKAFGVLQSALDFPAVSPYNVYPCGRIFLFSQMSNSPGPSTFWAVVFLPVVPPVGPLASQATPLPPLGRLSVLPMGSLKLHGLPFSNFLPLLWFLLWMGIVCVTISVKLFSRQVLTADFAKCDPSHLS